MTQKPWSVLSLLNYPELAGLLHLIASGIPDGDGPVDDVADTTPESKTRQIDHAEAHALVPIPTPI